MHTFKLKGGNKGEWFDRARGGDEEPRCSGRGGIWCNLYPQPRQRAEDTRKDISWVKTSENEENPKDWIKLKSLGK